jgi:nucleotide-binding universal stress UspA family protein
MINRPSVLCPVDFSEASRGALRYAAAVAEHFDGPLIVATIDDLLLKSGSDAAFGEGWLKRDRALSDLIGAVAPTVPATAVTASGDPVEEIYRLITRCGADLLVTGLHASLGAGPRMGAVTYRLLCKTHLPTLALPPQRRSSGRTSGLVPAAGSRVGMNSRRSAS